MIRRPPRSTQAKTLFPYTTPSDLPEALIQSAFVGHRLGSGGEPKLFPPLFHRRNLHTDPTSINSVFSSFYSSLYKSESSSDPTETNSFLDSLNFPVINPDVAKQLDLPLTVEEITCAMKTMQNNKAPGPGRPLSSAEHHVPEDACSWEIGLKGR